MIILRSFADVSLSAIPRWLFGSWGSPLPLYIVLRMVTCQESKSTASSVQNFLMRSAYSSIALFGRLLIISVVRPDSPGALSNAMLVMALFTSLKVGGFPSSWAVWC